MESQGRNGYQIKSHIFLGIIRQSFEIGVLSKIDQME